MSLDFVEAIPSKDRLTQSYCPFHRERLAEGCRPVEFCHVTVIHIGPLVCSRIYVSHIFPYQDNPEYFATGIGLSHHQSESHTNIAAFRPLHRPDYLADLPPPPSPIKLESTNL